ncbi:MAG: hypothetical protein WC869_08355 [Phycisphaerae bacterium]|jgi:hypothetical protein
MADTLPETLDAIYARLVLTEGVPAELTLGRFHLGLPGYEAWLARMEGYGFEAVVVVPYHTISAVSPMERVMEVLRDALDDALVSITTRRLNWEAQK